MASRPSGKKRAHNAEFQASFSGPRSRPNPHTLTRLDYVDGRMKTEERPLPVPMDVQEAIIQLLEPLEHERDPIDSFLDGEEAEGNQDEEEMVGGDDGEKMTQV